MSNFLFKFPSNAFGEVYMYLVHAESKPAALRLIKDCDGQMDGNDAECIENGDTTDDKFLYDIGSNIQAFLQFDPTVHHHNVVGSKMERSIEICDRMINTHTRTQIIRQIMETCGMDSQNAMNYFQQARKAKINKPKSE